MAHNEQHEELAALKSLRVWLGDAEERDFEQHLEERCPRCEQLLADFRLSASTLAVLAPLRKPRPRVRRKLLAALRAADRPAKPASSRLAGWVFAVAASLLFVAIGLDDARLRRQREEFRSQVENLAERLDSSETELARQDLRVRVLESEDIRLLLLEGQGPQPKARGKVFWSEKAKRGILLAGNLEPLPPDRQYQLWAFVDGRPVDAGVFDADLSGRAVYESRELVAAEKFAVTVEPRGGVPQPTGPIILLGSPSAG